MRFCGGFLRSKQLSCPKKGHKTGSATRESVHSALLAIDHADRDLALETGLAKRLESLDGGPAGRDDILDEADALARFVDPFQAVRGPVLLRLVADDQERHARGERRCRGKDDCAQLRARNSNRFGLVLRDGGGDVLAEHREKVGASLEAVLVEVVARAPPRTEDEVTLEVRVLPKSSGELFPSHERAARRASCASGSTLAASGEAPSSETMEPSAK
jgi:hypothetical protein